jgi:hypothetical protein
LVLGGGNENKTRLCLVWFAADLLSTVKTPFGKTCIGRLPTAELPQTLQCEICKPPDRPQSQHASSDLTCEGFLTKWQDEQIPTRTTNTQCASRRTPMATQSEKREGLAVRHIAF